MTAVHEPKRLQWRQHANGRIAEVYLQHDGRFYAREALSHIDVERTARFRDNIDTFKLAQRLADQAAHPGCNGNCAAWQNDPDALNDPRCAAHLLKHRCSV